MSETTTVTQVLPPEYDMFMDEKGGLSNGRTFDPAFTADITQQMSVPHRIGAAGRYDDAFDLYKGDTNYDMSQSAAHMDIPDKIVLIGEDRSLGVRDEPNLHLDFGSMAAETFGYVNVTTPPRVLTLEDRPFPSLDDGYVVPAAKPMMNGGVGNDHRNLRAGLRGSLDETGQLDSSALADSSLAYLGNGIDGDLIVMQRQISRLQRHVANLETANSQRNRRELVLYPLVIGFILMRVAKWFLGNAK